MGVTMKRSLLRLRYVKLHPNMSTFKRTRVVSIFVKESSLLAAQLMASYHVIVMVKGALKLSALIV